MKICPNCSARNYNNAEFCFNCRTPIANAPIYPDPVPQYPPMMNPYTQPACPPQPKNEQPAPKNEEPPKEETPAPKSEQPKDEDAKPKTAKKGNPLLIVFAVIAGLLLITNGITLYYLLNSEQMKYKDAYISLQKTALKEDLYESLRSGNESGSGSTKASTDVPVAYVKPTATPTPEPEEKYLPLKIGQRFDLEDVEIQIDSVQWGDEILPSNTSGRYRYYSASDGEKFFFLWGTVKNNKGETIRLYYSLNVEFTFNDKYTYSPTIEGEEKDGTGIWNFEANIDPLETKRFVIFRSVPDEVYDIYDHCVVTIGYYNDFSWAQYDEFEELDKVYQLYVQ